MDTTITHRPLADLLDVAVVALAGLLVGGGVAAALLADAADDAWAELGAALLGVGAGLVAALAAWVWVLVTIARRATSPGSRVVGLAATRPLPAAGRHLAVVVVLWAALGTAAAAVEPWPAGPLGGGLGAAVATAAALTAWGSGPWSIRWRTVGIAAVVGLLLTGAFPDRASYPWELRREAETAMVAALDDDPAAARVCGGHVTSGCVDPDRVWRVDGRRGTVADRLLGVVRDAVGRDARVALTHGAGELLVQVDGDTVAIVRHRADCAVEVVVDRYASPVAGADRVTCP